MKRTTILFFLLTSLFAYSQDWEQIGENDSGKYFYKPYTKNTAWVKKISDKIEYFVDSPIKPKIVDGYQLVLWKFDCDDKKIGILQINTYTAHEKLLQSRNVPSYLMKMDYVTPDSIGEIYIETFCHGK